MTRAPAHATYTARDSAFGLPETAAYIDGSGHGQLWQWGVSVRGGLFCHNFTNTRFAIDLVARPAYEANITWQCSWLSVLCMQRTR